MPETTKHEAQHADDPTWCIWCGTFSCYFRADMACSASRVGPAEYDSRRPDSAMAMIGRMLGLERGTA